MKPYKEAREEVVSSFHRAYIAGLLQASGGNVSKAARYARMDRSYLIKLLHKYDLKPGVERRSAASEAE